jgi:hypothetical protein
METRRGLLQRGEASGYHQRVRIVSALVPDTTSRLGSPAKLWGGPLGGPPDSPFVSELTVIHAREADGGVGCGPADPGGATRPD